MRTKAWIAAVGIVLLQTALPASAWEPAPSGQPVAIKKGGWAMVFPDGWLYDRPDSRELLASHDGILLNSIEFELEPHKDIFKLVKRESRPDSLPEDLAESYVAWLKAVGGLFQDVELISSEPAELAGRPAFRVHVKYRLPERLGRAAYEQTTLGTPLENGLLLVTFRAPAVHHYAKWLPAFESVLPSVQPVTVTDRKR